MNKQRKANTALLSLIFWSFRWKEPADNKQAFMCVTCITVSSWEPTHLQSKPKQTHCKWHSLLWRAYCLKKDGKRNIITQFFSSIKWLSQLAYETQDVWHRSNLSLISRGLLQKAGVLPHRFFSYQYLEPYDYYCVEVNFFWMRTVNQLQYQKWSFLLLVPCIAELLSCWRYRVPLQTKVCRVLIDTVITA